MYVAYIGAKTNAHPPFATYLRYVIAVALLKIKIKKAGGKIVHQCSVPLFIFLSLIFPSLDKYAWIFIRFEFYCVCSISHVLFS